MENLPLYNFEKAKLTKSFATITPPIFILRVWGEMKSLNPTINLVRTGEVKDGYVVVRVEGKDGDAIGSAGYTRQTSFQEVKGTKGVVVIGENKTVELDYADAGFGDTAETTAATPKLGDINGMHEIVLKSYVNDELFGVSETTLRLTIDGNCNVAGTAVVTNPSLEHPILCQSHVTGKYYPSSIMINPSTIEVSGYPEIHWPKGAGIGPVILENYKASVALYGNGTNDPHQQDTISYQYRNTQMNWVKLNQLVKVITD